MDRRKSLKVLALGSLSAGIVLEACKDGDKKVPGAPLVPATDTKFTLDRMVEEKELYKQVTSTTFFTPHEMTTITVLGDIIIPKDEVSGSASDAKVPEWIEFIVKDMPEHQTPMRGGLRWLDVQCLKRYEKSFIDCDDKQKIEMVDEIAWPARKTNKPDMAPGIAFFSYIRNLVSTGFYTSEIGVKDIGYAGNTPNKWNGVPDEVLKQYSMAYTEKELKECAKY